ncbi:MAG: alpha-glucosidase/alpha-galactosidase [Oscillospiraceae bacterium]|nr:alpha-glucosidase/alpha-galactosidase [Oscillospiraceae bacterium]
MVKKDNFNFVFIGAGSTSFTLRLVSDILHEDDFIKSGELRLVDIDPAALGDAYAAVAKMIETSGRDFKVTKHLDFEEALPGCDFLYFTFVTGSYPSWKKDIEICEKHNVIQSVGDTIGPGGIIRTLRNVPVVHSIAKRMEQVAPDAWIINYSNPEGALCLAISKYTNMKTFGLCHGTPDTVRTLAANVYKVDPSELVYGAAGINHLTWITKLEIDGADVYPKLRGLLEETGFDKNEPISSQLFDIFGLYPAPGDRHVGEFFPYYLKEDVLQEKNYRWKNIDFAEMDAWRNGSLDNIKKLKEGKIGFKEFGTSGETSVHFMRALATGKICVEMANVINLGYIDNISDGVIVEVPVFVDKLGLHPQKIGRLPDAIAAKCDALGREYGVAVRAAVECDKALALQAMMLDPLCANCKYPEALLDDLISAYIDLLPAKWKSQV